MMNIIFEKEANQDEERKFVDSLRVLKRQRKLKHFPWQKKKGNSRSECKT